jgi:hypothetical protein
MNIKTPISKTKIIIVASIAALAGGYLLYASINHLPPFALSSPDPGDYTINLEKSNAEKQRTQELQQNPEQKIVNEQSDIPTTPTTDVGTGKQNANVILSFASIQNGIVSAGGYVTNVVEDGGTCIYTFTKGGAVIEKTAATMQNPTSTSCATTRFLSTELGSGTWSVVLTYGSSASAGVSNTKEVTK